MNPKWSEEEVLLLKDKYSRLTNDELIALFPNKTFLATETQFTPTIATYLSWNFATVKIQAAVQSHSQNPMIAL